MSAHVPEVSVTVVAYNSESCIGRALSSVREDVRTGYAEVIVVDNASPDNSAEVAVSVCPEARVIQSDQNRYFAGGCNLSWPHVHGRLWLLLNPDVTVPDRGLRDLVEWMDAHPTVGAASPNVVGDDGGPMAPARRFPSIGLALLELTRLHRLMKPSSRADAFLGSYYPNGEHLDVDWVVGASLIARREAVEHAGLLSEQVAMYGEDSEWCGRIRASGWKVALAGLTPWVHTGEASTSRTWNDNERALRICRGIYDSRRLQKGLPYVAVLWLINLCAFSIEAAHPTRSFESRQASRALVRAHLSLARSLIPSPHTVRQSRPS
jgi:hypothetical protein